jgi:hypothetical protein
MSDATSSPRLAAKLASMIGAVSGVEKRGWNPSHKYHYVTAIDVYEATRDLMAKHNVILLQRALLDRVERVDRPTKYGGTMTNIRMGWEFVWVCGDTGETISVPWLSEAEDGQDKGPNKAATAARKYFLISQLQIPVDQIAQEDADAGHQAPAQVAPQQKPNNARRQAPPAPPPPGTNPAYRMLAALAQKVHQEPKPLQAVIDTLTAEGIIAEELGVVNRLTDLPLSIVERAVAHYRALAEESR